MITEERGGPRPSGSRARNGPRRALPLHIRLLRRASARTLPAPVCGVALETGLEVPVADGVTLLADHFIPLTGGPGPTLLVRSPYGRGFPFDYLYGALFAGQGFHVLLQSCRGTGGSGGAFEPWQHEREDGHATVAWLRGQDWFSGALGTAGPSYLSYTQWRLAQDPPPELRAMAVQVGAYQLYDFLYAPGGAFALENALTGAAAMLTMHRGFPRFVAAMLRLRRPMRLAERRLPLIERYPAALGGRAGFFEDFITHPDPGDAFWGAYDAGTGIGGVAVPVSLVGGWDDVCLGQTLEAYRRLTEGGGHARLTVGPWNHTSAFDRGLPVVFGEAVSWLRAHLGGEPAGDAPGAPVRVYVRGREEWRDLPAWPPPAVASRWYAGEGGTLAGQAPARAGVSSFRYDPARPTPSAGGPVLNARTAGPVRNNALEARSDVLVFTSAPLAGPLEVIGPVRAQVPVRGSGPHFDVFARLCDVDERGVSRNVCDGLVRHQPDAGRDADGWADGWSAVTVPMSATAHQFAAGHRLRLQVSGGAHPRYGRNTGSGEPMATATELVPVDIEIGHSPGGPATLLLPVVSPGL